MLSTACCSCEEQWHATLRWTNFQFQIDTDTDDMKHLDRWMDGWMDGCMDRWIVREIDR
jgi:hypothetical protein